MTLKTAVPASVVIGSLTAPTGSANAASITSGATPRSGIGASRVISSVVLGSTPAAFAIRSKSAAPFSFAASVRRLLTAHVPRLLLDDFVADPVRHFLELGHVRGLDAGDGDEGEPASRRQRSGHFLVGLQFEGTRDRFRRGAEAGNLPVPREEFRFLHGQAVRLGGFVQVRRAWRPRARSSARDRRPAPAPSRSRAVRRAAAAHRPARALLPASCPRA